jgi:hypothetical protein
MHYLTRGGPPCRFCLRPRPPMSNRDWWRRRLKNCDQQRRLKKRMRSRRLVSIGRSSRRFGDPELNVSKWKRKILSFDKKRGLGGGFLIVSQNVLLPPRYRRGRSIVSWGLLHQIEAKLELQHLSCGRWRDHWTVIRSCTVRRSMAVGSGFCSNEAPMRGD